MSAFQGETSSPPTTLHPHWRGTIDALCSATRESLLVAPLFIVDHEPYRRRSQERQATTRSREVGTKLARIFGGSYYLETRGHNFKSASEEHVDGVVDPYLQVHTTYFADRDLQTASVHGATRFIMRRYALPEGLTIGDFIPPKPYQLLRTEYANSMPIQHAKPPYIDISFAKKMSVAGHQLPPAHAVYAFDVPIGSTAVFLNGFGQGNEVLSHETMSVSPNGSPATFQRIASLGRVVVPGGV